MSQANAISTLRNEVKSLKKRLIDNDQRACASDDQTGQSRSSSPFGEINAIASASQARYLALEAIASALTSACPDVVDEIVDQIRGGVDLVIVAASAKARGSSTIATVDHVWNYVNTNLMAGRAVPLDPHLNDSPGAQGAPRPPVDWVKLAESDAMQTNCIREFSIPGFPRDWEPFISVFIEKFISDFAPENPWRHRSSVSRLDTSWLRTLAHGISSYPYAKCALRCVAIAYFGKIAGDRGISLAAQNMYAASLRLLHRELAQHAIPSTDNLCTALCLWIFEVFHHPSPVFGVFFRKHILYLLTNVISIGSLSTQVAPLAPRITCTELHSYLNDEVPTVQYPGSNMKLFCSSVSMG
jgi:hypothetical protein